MKLRWQDVVAKLTGGQPDAATPPPPADANAAPPAEPTANATTPESVEPSPMSSHSNSEPSPRQSAVGGSAFNAQDGVRSISGGDRTTAFRGVHSDPVARVYAEALLQLAESQGNVDAVADEVDQIEELLRGEPKLRQMLESPAIGTDQRRDLIERVFKGRVSDTTFKFFQVVNAKKRASALPKILAAFTQLLAEKRGIVEVNVQVAQRLSSDEAKQVGDRIAAALNKCVVLHQFVDESLIGGMIIRVGDQVIDGSVATQLRSLKRKLIERGRDRARQANHD